MAGKTREKHVLHIIRLYEQLRKKKATPEEVAQAGYAALNKGKRYALPGLSVTLQSIWIRMMPLRAMASFVYKKSVKEMNG